MDQTLNPEVNSLKTAVAPEDATGTAVLISEPAFTPTKFIPKVRKCSLAYFKNRFSANEDLYAVDVLEAESPEIGPQIQEELRIRQNVPRRRGKDRTKTGNAKTLVGMMQKPVAGTSQGFHFGPSGRMWLSRIRIQSPAILRVLSRIMSTYVDGDAEVWDDTPRTFNRPFSGLIFHHARMCEYLAGLQERWGGSSHYDSLDPTLSGARTPSSVAESPAEQETLGSRQAIDDCPAALAELSCYVKFMNQEVMELYHKFDHLSAETTLPAKVRFHDLWYLFRVGELVYRAPGTGSDKEVSNIGQGNRTWRCYGTRPAWEKYRITPGENRSYTNDDESERSSFGVHCYYIDYTGDEFCVVTETFEIPRFSGERTIKSLKVCPYRFAGTGQQELFRSALDNGYRFLQITKTKHAAYNGWTTTVTPKGGPTVDVEGNEVRRPEFIDSEVIVDFGEAIQTCPTWKPEADFVRPEDPNILLSDDDFTICWWSDKDRSRLLRETTEVMVILGGITAFERNANISPDNPSADKFLIKVRENDRNGKPTTEADLCQDENDPRCDLLLLPSRVFAYVLRDRKFSQIVVQKLTPVKKSGDAFEYLKINQRNKEMIQSLVEEHFETKSNDRERGVDIGSIDLIRGKGKGLFILLHGVPGVGKTATAEAIASANGKPLFPITCGDLGLTPTAVEAALLRIFRLADTWNCVLLLDEVDTFFSQRARGDSTIEKGALVSVFLRVLEYYDGLLFLTTNRPGSLDEAFKSRIHLSLYYPDLKFNQTMEIWQMNMDRLERIEQARFERAKGTMTQPLQIMRTQILRFAEKIFKAQKSNRWNGRQIRNAFQVASSLAHYDARKDDCPPKLTVEHFKTIFSVTQDFDEFMTETHGGKTAKDIAYDRGDRADHFQGHRQSEDGIPDEDESEDEDSLGRDRRDDGRHRQHHVGPFRRQESRRSRSPNLAAIQTGGRSIAGGGGGLFGSSSGFNRKGSRPPLSPRHRAEPDGFNPSIKVTTSGGPGSEFMHRGSDHSDREVHLSPDHAGGSQWERKVSGSGGGNMKRKWAENVNMQQERPWQKGAKKVKRSYKYLEEDGEEDEE